MPMVTLAVIHLQSKLDHVRMLYDLMTVLLILMPLQPPLPAHVGSGAWASLKRITLAAEVVGPHERWIDDYRSEVRYVRYRWRETQSMPPLCDADRLPSLEICRAYQEFCKSRKKSLEASRYTRIWNREEYDKQLTAASRIIEVVGYLCTASNKTETWPARRRALQRLKEANPVAYYGGSFHAIDQ